MNEPQFQLKYGSSVAKKVKSKQNQHYERIQRGHLSQINQLKEQQASRPDNA